MRSNHGIGIIPVEMDALAELRISEVAGEVRVLLVPYWDPGWQVVAHRFRTCCKLQDTQISPGVDIGPDGVLEDLFKRLGIIWGRKGQIAVRSQDAIQAVDFVYRLCSLQRECAIQQCLGYVFVVSLRARRGSIIQLARLVDEMSKCMNDVTLSICQLVNSALQLRSLHRGDRNASAALVGLTLPSQSLFLQGPHPVRPSAVYHGRNSVISRVRVVFAGYACSRC